MHLPDGILSGHAEVVGAVAAAGGLGVAARAARHEISRVPAGRVAAVGALVFAGQMVNVPVASGTSGHLLGAALAVALLGPGLGVLTTAAVIIVQAVGFADGGASSLGLNLLNMAIVPGAVAAALIGSDRSSLRAPRLAAAAGLGTLAAAAAFSAQYALASLGGDPAGAVVRDMLAVHVPIAVLEVALTVGAVAAVRAVDARPAVVSVAALAVATLIAPWASSAPDGMERVAIDRDFASLAGAHPFEASPFADYAVSGIGNDVLTATLAGLAGVAVMAGLLAAGARAAKATVRA